MFRVLPNIDFKHLVAITLVVATFVVSCKREAQGEIINLEEVPVQTVDSMYAVQTKNGILQMRMEAPVMQRFKTTENSYELFPKGFYVYAYNAEGLLETKISANVAKHTTKENEEKWEAFGDVVINNFVKGEKMLTDTLYWDRENKKIYTHCFVKMFSPDGYMQGFGMESDEMARNANILRPFDSYGVVKKDSLNIYVDSVNFIGPFRQK